MTEPQCPPTDITTVKEDDNSASRDNVRPSPPTIIPEKKNIATLKEFKNFVELVESKYINMDLFCQMKEMPRLLVADGSNWRVSQMFGQVHLERDKVSILKFDILTKGNIKIQHCLVNEKKVMDEIINEVLPFITITDRT